MPSTMTLSDYLKAERGRTNTLAALLGVSASLVTQWGNGKRVAAERCIAIEKATGGAVSRRELRPADWQLIWPDTDEKQAA